MRMALALAAAFSGAVASPTAGGLDLERSEVRFTVAKLGFSDVTGVFRVFDGELRYDAAQPENSAIQWRICIASVATGDRDRDRALQGTAYFHAERYPQMSFESRTVRRMGDDLLHVSGDLTIRGVTREIAVPVRVTRQQGVRAFVADFTLDRYDYDIHGGSVMSRLIGRTVRVHLVAVERSRT